MFKKFIERKMSQNLRFFYQHKFSIEGVLIKIFPPKIKKFSKIENFGDAKYENKHIFNNNLIMLKIIKLIS